MKNCFITILLLFAASVCVAQDTLILKPGRTKLADTLVVKLLRVESKDIVAYPYEKFYFTAKDSIAIANKKPLGRRGDIKVQVEDLVSIKYDEKLKHTVFFNDYVAERRKEQEFYNQKKNIISIGGGVFYGPISLSLYNFNAIDPDIEYQKNPFAVFLASYERIIWRGVVGLRVVPVMVGINDKMLGAGAGFRIYPIKQRKATLYLGSDFIFNNNTVFRRAYLVDTAKIYIRSVKQNRNQLLVAPFQAGLMINTKSNYIFDLGISIGPNIVFGNRNVTINNEPYKIRTAPAFTLARLMIGRKY